MNQADSEGYTPLHEAGDKVAAQCLIEAGANINAVNADGETPVNLLTDVDLLEALADVYDIDTKTEKYGQTPLMRALDTRGWLSHRARGSWKEEFAKVLKLIELGADVSLVDNGGKSAVHYAALRDDTKSPDLEVLLKKLADAGMNPNIQEKNGEIAFHMLGKVSWGYRHSEGNLRAFLDIMQPDTEIQDNQGKTALFKVVETLVNQVSDETMAILRTFAEAGARFDVRDLEGRTLLHAAAPNCLGDTEHMKFLIEQGLDPNSQVVEGNTIWHEATPKFCSWSVRPDVYRAFTALGADIAKKNHRGKSPLHVLSQSTQWVEEQSWEKQNGPSLLEYMLSDKSIEIDAHDDRGVTPVHIASTFSPLLVKRLLAAGANAAKTTAEGLNAFHLAARSRQSNVIGILTSWMRSQDASDALLDAANHRDNQNRTPLYYACASGRFESV